MSASFKKRETFPTTTLRPFPKVTKRKIETKKFLEAANGSVAFIDKLGPKFYFVKSDLYGNIKQVRQKYDEDQSKFFYLNDMILAEKAQGHKGVPNALLWLKRGLEFWYLVFKYMIDAKKSSHDMKKIMEDAYEETLKNHHNKALQMIVQGLFIFCPNREEIMKILAPGPKDDETEKKVNQQISSFLVNFKSNKKNLEKLYSGNKIEQWINSN